MRHCLNRSQHECGHAICYGVFTFAARVLFDDFCSYSSSTARKPDFKIIMLSLGIPLLRTYCLLFKMSFDLLRHPSSCGLCQCCLRSVPWHLLRRGNRKVCSPAITPPLLEYTFFPCISNFEGYRCKEVQSANYLCLFQTNRLT